MSKRRIVSLVIAAILCLQMLPVGAFAANGSNSNDIPLYVGSSSVPTQVYKSLNFDIDYKEIQKQAESTLSPYGNGYTSLIPNHELITGYRVGGLSGIMDMYYDNILQNHKVSMVDYSLNDSLMNAVAARSSAFDPIGKGQDEGLATVYAESSDGKSEIYLSVSLPENNNRNSAYSTTVKLTAEKHLPFALTAEDAGGYLAIATGNFDGDEENTDEIAVYRPFYSEQSYLLGGNMAGTIDIFRLSEKDGQWGNKTYKLEVVESYDLSKQSSYYFYNNNYTAMLMGLNDKAAYKDDWKFKYRVPTVGLEAVEQTYSAADDLCVTFSPALGGADVKDTGFEINGEIKAKRPYDTATSVFFWIDPLTKNEKKTTHDQMRFNWKDDYEVNINLDEDAGEKWDVMAFGGAGAGDINGDGLSEVVVAGYMFDKRKEVFDGSDGGDWNFSKHEYLVTYYQYDAERNTYIRVNQCPNWIEASDDAYEKAYNVLTGTYTNIGSKDITHQAVPVTCFAERGSGNAESIAVAGIICKLNTETGMSECTPYEKEGYLMSYNFEFGTIDGVYAIPVKYLNDEIIDKNTQNRLFGELVAGNFDGNLLGKEQLAFTYIIKEESKNRYYTAAGIICQKEIDNNKEVYNVNSKDKKYVGSGIYFKTWSLIGGTSLSPATVAAVDFDNDSVIMRKSNKENTYFFSDPEIVAVLQAAPYFEDVDYGAGNNGKTIFSNTQGTETEENHGITAGITVQAGIRAELSVGVTNGFSITAGVSTEFTNMWGTGGTKSLSLEFETQHEDTVALVMTPIVRYYYEVFDAKSNTWEPTEVDVSSTPRVTVITVDEYDIVAKTQGWELIRNNIINNIAGVPSSYGSSTAKKDGYVGGSTLGYGTGNFVRLGVGDGSSITQEITTGSSDIVTREWSVCAVSNQEVITNSASVSVNTSIGYTGNKTDIKFKELEYSGTVVSVPRGYEAYSFAWQFGQWNDSMIIQGIEQKFPVLGYLVKEVKQPIAPIKDTMLHVAENGIETLTLAWLANAGAITDSIASDGYALYRLSQGVYYPLASFDIDSAEDGVLYFTDEYVNPYQGYEYAIRPYAKTGDGVVYGDYIDSVVAYTQSDSEDAPQVTVTAYDTQRDGTRYTTYNASYEVGQETSALGGIVTTWQQYMPKEGGWKELPMGHNTKTVEVETNENIKIRCVVTQRVGKEIYTVYATPVKTELVFVAWKSYGYVDKSGDIVVDYLLVNENGQNTVVASTNDSLSVNKIYFRNTDKDNNTVYTEGRYNYNIVGPNGTNEVANLKSGDMYDALSATLPGLSALLKDQWPYTIRHISNIWDVSAVVDYMSNAGKNPILNRTDAAEYIKKITSAVKTELQEDDKIAIGTEEQEAVIGKVIFKYGVFDPETDVLHTDLYSDGELNDSTDTEGEEPEEVKLVDKDITAMTLPELKEHWQALSDLGMEMETNAPNEGPEREEWELEYSAVMDKANETMDLILEQEPEWDPWS